MRIQYEAAIVIYNKKIEHSITCEYLKRISSLYIRIIVIDNSDSDQGNAAVCGQRGYKYISMNGNKGLSKAYNAAVDNAKADVIILLDDDTEVTSEYFIKLNSSVKQNPEIDIFAPIVYGQDGVIYSPNEFNFLRNHFISSADQNVSQERFNAIASGLAIRMRVFDNYRFDETLFVDQVDQYFFCEQRKLKRKFMKIDAVLHQNFHQRGAELTADSGWRRLRLRIEDLMRQARLMGEPQYILLGYVKCCGLGIQIGRKSKSACVTMKAIVLSTKLLIIPQ